MRRLSATLYCCLVLTLMFVVTNPLRGQVTGRVVGAVVDQQKRALANAHVSLYRSNGAEPLVETQTTSAGNFVLDSITPGVYRLVIDLASFSNFEVANLTISPGADTPLNNVVLEIGATKTTVETAATSDAVQMSNAELSTTLSHDQLQELPQLLHDPLKLIQTQVGVSYNLNTYTTVDGLRPAYNNVTLDGINIQDNYYRAQSLDYLPNRLFLDQIQEFTLVTGNQRAIYGGGATQVAFATPSGNNAYHGELYYLASPNVLNANEWIANTIGEPNPYKRNQGGATFSGPILKDRLFFFTNYELLRYDNGLVQDVYSPTPYMRSLVTNTAMQSLLNAIPLPNTGTDPYFNFFRYLAQDRRDRDNATGKLDYYLSPKQSITATYAWNREKFNDLGTGSEQFCCLPTPNLQANDARNFAALAWRSTVGPAFTNEVRFGFNLAPLNFVRQGTQPSYLVYTLAPYGATYTPVGVPFGENQLYLDPSFPAQLFANNFGSLANDLGSSLDSKYYTIQDNASWTKGKQTLQYGFQWELVHANRSYTFDSVPIYEIAGGSLAGIETGALTNAIESAAIIRGGSGLAVQPIQRRYSYNTIAFYGEHTLRLSRRLTTTLGLRYENNAPVRDEDNILLRPDPINGNYLTGLLSPLGNLNFANGSLYNRDNFDLAPSVGVAFDPFGQGKTAVRAGYSIAYVNDDIVQAMENLVGDNANRFLASCTNCAGQSLGQTQAQFTFPHLGAPVPFSILGQPAAIYTIDPNLRTPYVQEWSVGVQQEWKSFLLQAAFVGNHATGMLRGVNLNQANLGGSGFLSDFNALQSALQSYAQTGKLALPSNPLTAYLVNFNNPDNLNSEYNNIKSGQAGAVAYDVGTAAGYQVYQNRYAQNGAGVLGNYSQSNYNALQLDARRRLRNGLQVQLNYTFSKVLSDVATTYSPYEPYRDANNPKLDYSRAPFDLAHAIKANFIYQLPFGPGQKFSNIPWRPVLGGWSFSGMFTRQSGTPFSILSGYATLDYEAAQYNTANPLVQGSVLSSLFGVRHAAGGTYFIWDAGSNASKDFTNPSAGQAGYLQPRQFSGPWATDFDFGIQKRFTITERQSAAIRFEATNIFNHPSYYIGNQNINASNFGQITSTFYPARKAQLTLYYRF